jgi:hypothetical protein
MATERLIVELDAKTQKLEAALARTDKKLDKVEQNARKTTNSFKDIGKQGAMAAAALGVAVGAMVQHASTLERELRIAAQRSGESVESLQSLAFATNTVGISLEKLGDISKDTNERIGEFLATGGGTFKDFVDVMKLSEMEASALAETFKTMSGPDILQQMVKMMEDAGVSGKQMSFALEGMASDAQDLLPLLTDNADALKNLRTEFDDLNITISEADLEKVRQVGEEFSKLKSTFSQEATQLVADYSEEIINAINVTGFIVQKTIDGFNIIATGWGNLIELAQSALTDFVNGTDTLSQTLMERSEESAEELNEFFGTQWFDFGKNAGQQYQDGMAEGLNNLNKPLEIIIKQGKVMSQWEKMNRKDQIGVYQNYIKAFSTLSDQYLEENKAVNAGLIIADTAAGVMKAFATSSTIYEAYANAAVVVATGIVQLNNVLSATKGGGSMSGGTVGSAGGSSAQQQDFQPETSTLDVTEQVAGEGVTTQRIIISTDDGEDIFSGIARGLEDRRARGL